MLVLHLPCDLCCCRSIYRATAAEHLDNGISNAVDDSGMFCVDLLDVDVQSLCTCTAQRRGSSWDQNVLVPPLAGFVKDV